MEMMDESFWFDPSVLKSGLLNQTIHLRDLKDIRKRLDNDQLTTQLFLEISFVLSQINAPALALTSLDRLLANTPEPGETVNQWLREKERFHRFIRMLGSSSFLSQILIQQYPDIMDLITVENQKIRREQLIEIAISLTSNRQSENEVTDALRRFRLQWTVMIATADLLDQAAVRETTRRISDLADACLEAALKWSLERARKRYGTPLTGSGEVCQIVAIALGKLGGVELNYSSDVDLIFICDDEGHTQTHRPIRSSEFFSRVISDFLRVLGGSASSLFVLRVDLRLRPEGNQGPLIMSLEQTLAYYDSVGRTWERQALIKMRPCAGSLALGEEFRVAIEPFVYERYLTSMEIAEIQALKRRIEHRAQSTGVSEWDVKTGHGGIRDIEFLVQFLQLLNGRNLREIRNSNSLESMWCLRNNGCLKLDEYERLQQNYIFLRKIEHLLQLSDDRQTHKIPANPESRRRLANQMGFLAGSVWEGPDGPFERFSRDYKRRTSENNAILNRLLHHAFFMDEPQGSDPLSDLILDPEMPEEIRVQALNPIGFSNQVVAFENLQAMAREENPYFSTPRCRHFFAALIPKLLKSIMTSASPDQTLTAMESISRGFPGKAEFWESLNSSPGLIQAFTEIAGLNKIARDSMLTRPESIGNWVRFSLNDQHLTCEEIQSNITSQLKYKRHDRSVLRDTRDDLWLRVVLQHRFPLSGNDVRNLTSQLSNIADSIIRYYANQIQEEGLIRWRQITGQNAGPGKWHIIALGKLGGEDLLFHSDLDLMFLHEVNPEIIPNRLRLSAESYFQDLAARLIRGLDGVGPKFVYRIDTRLRPFGSSGPLSISVEQFEKYYRSKDSRLWERLALLRARPIYLDPTHEIDIRELVRDMTFLNDHSPSEIANEIRYLRDKTLNSKDDAISDLKRAKGGVHEAELLIQALQMRHFRASKTIAKTNILDAIQQLQNPGILKPEIANRISQIYLFYREIETVARIYRNRLTSHLVIQNEELPFLDQMIDQNSIFPGLTIPQKIHACQTDLHEIFQSLLQSL